MSAATSRRATERRNYGTLRNHQLSHPIVGMSPTQSGKGYWLAGTDGGVFAFG